MTDSARYTLKDCGLKSSTVTVNTSELDHKGRIGIQKARELALAHAGLKDAVFSEGEYDLDDGIYELEFTAGGIEYEYEVNAFTGKSQQLTGNATMTGMPGMMTTVMMTTVMTTTMMTTTVMTTNVMTMTTMMMTIMMTTTVMTMTIMMMTAMMINT